MNAPCVLHFQGIVFVVAYIYRGPGKKFSYTVYVNLFPPSIPIYSTSFFQFGALDF